MEGGESSLTALTRAYEKQNISLHITHPNSLQTLEAIEARPKRGRGKSDPENTVSDIWGFENSGETKYASQLPQGWLLEKRVMKHGRKYMYFYDPLGKQYRHFKDAQKAIEAASRTAEEPLRLTSIEVARTVEEPLRLTSIEATRTAEEPLRLTSIEATRTAEEPLRLTSIEANRTAEEPLRLTSIEADRTAEEPLKNED